MQKYHISKKTNKQKTVMISVSTSLFDQLIIFVDCNNHGNAEAPWSNRDYWVEKIGS